MIRPVMGKNPYFIGVDENQEVVNNLTLYPNPTTDFVRIDGIDENNCSEISIFDLTGRLVRKYPYCNELNVSDLQNGIYLLRVTVEDGACMTSKLLISK